MSMTRISCVEPGTLVVESAPIPTRGAGEVLVRIRRVGICGTDFHIYRGSQPYLSYPRVFGHELAAEVVEAGEGSAWKPGDAVCIMPYHHCGHCVACRKGRTNCCTNISVLGVHKDGGLAEYLAISEDYLVSAEGLSLDQAAMVEFLSIGRHAVQRAKPGKRDRVLVVGAGPIGMATCYFAARDGAEVTVIDSNAGRVSLCVDALGARRGEVLGNDIAARLAALTDDEFFDVVFDATGNAAAIEAGFAYVAHAGTYVLVSIVPADITFNDPEFHKRETALLGSRNATNDDFAAVIEALRDGAFPSAAVHSHSVELQDVPTAMEALLAPGSGVIKALITV